MTGKVITGQGLSTEGVTVVIGIEDLMILCTEATKEMTGMVGRVTDEISNMGEAAHPLQYGYRNNNHGFTSNYRGRRYSSGRYARRQGY